MKAYKEFAKIIAGIIVFSMLFNLTTLFVSAKTLKAEWDGYVEEDADKDFKLMDFNNFKSIFESGAVPSSINKSAEYGFSARWFNHSAHPTFWIGESKVVLSDWTEFDDLYLTIYSAKITDTKIQGVVSCPDVPEGSSYFGFSFKTNWLGWKTLKFPLSEMGVNRGASFDNIVSFRLVGNNGWDTTGNPENDLYIADVRLKRGDKLNFVHNFYEEDVVNETLSDLSNSIAVYGGAANVVTENGASNLEYEIDFSKKTVMVPINIFEEYFAATTNVDGDSFAVSLNGKKVSGMVGNTSLTVAGNTIKQTEAAYSKDSRIYVDGETMAKALGFSAFTDGRLLVMGTETAYNAFHRPEHLGVNEKNEIAAYLAATEKIEAGTDTTEDCNDIKAKWVKYLVGGETLNDLSDPVIKARIDAVESSAKSNWEQMIKAENSAELFEGMTSNTSNDMTAAFGKIYEMSKGYATPNNVYYHNDDLKNDILYALEWMHKNRYEKKSVTRWTFTGFDNWWDWAIGSPLNLMPTLLLMEDALTDKQISEYLAYFDEQYWTPRLTGANFTWLTENIMASALLQNQTERILQTMVMYQKMYMYGDDNKRFVESDLDENREALTVPKSEGFYTDGSYIMHGHHAMNASYGITHLDAVCFMQYLIAGTVFDINSPFEKNLPELYYKTYDSVIFNSGAFRNTFGRNPGSSIYTKAADCIMSIFEIADSFEEDDKQKIYSIVKDAVETSPNINWYSSLSIEGINKLKQLMADDTIKARTDDYRSYIFYNADKATHIADDWGFALGMSSYRMYNYESINGENLTGWYQNDGRTEWFLKGNDINGASIDWTSMNPYRLPGTTVDTQERAAVSIKSNQAWLSSKDFVGGVTLDGKYSTAVMDLESYHESGAPQFTDTGYGGGRPDHTNDLTAKKSYFMFDDEVVCLGMGVNAKNNNNAEVLTIVDNVRARKVKSLSDTQESGEPYKVLSAVASATPEAENIASNTIDMDYSTKWAAELNGEIVWDLGESKPLGFIDLAFINGSKRMQKFELYVSTNGNNWEKVFSGTSSGKTDFSEYFDLKSSVARYVKFVNLGNTGGSTWVSLREILIYPPNSDGSVGIKEGDYCGTDTVIADGEQIELLCEQDTALQGVGYVNFADLCGYVFPENAGDNQGQLNARWTNNKYSHFELWFSHGVNPTNSTYAYIILPGKTAEQTAEYSANKNIEILANNSEVQAVKNNKLGITSIVFWKAGTFGDITAEQPCMVMYYDIDGKFEISVSDPTQKLETINISVNRVLTPATVDEEAKCSVTGNNTRIQCVTSTGTRGRSYCVSFNK